VYSGVHSETSVAQPRHPALPGAAGLARKVAPIGLVARGDRSGTLSWFWSRIDDGRY
jgi:hypothetical protein